MTEYNRLTMAQSYLCDAMKSLRDAQNEILTADNDHPYLEDRIIKIVNGVHNFQHEVARLIKLDTTLGKGGES